MKRDKDVTNMVLRYYPDIDNKELSEKQLFEFLERSGVHRVILFSAKFHSASSFQSLDYYKKHSEYLGDLKKRLEEVGVEVGINVLFTFGHCFWPSDNEFDFRRAVTIDGEESRGCACSLDEKLLVFTRELYSYYAKINPSVIFIDDDLRFVSLGKMICFCDEHLELISKKCGRKLTREEIKAHIMSENGAEDEIKKLYFEQMKEDRDRMVTEIVNTVKAISPSTEIGIMTDSYPLLTFGLDLKEFFKNFYDLGVTRIRPHMNYYREADRKDIPLEFSMPAIQRALIDDNRIELQPEVENDTYGFFYKSNNTTDMQLAWCLTNGFRNMQINIFDHTNSVADNFEEITKMFEDKKPYYAALTELIPENKVSCGVSIYINNNAVEYRRVRDDDLFFEESWYRWLQLDGIPIGYEFDKSPWKFLCGDTIDAASDKEIDEILKSGALIDLRAAQILLKRGFGKRIGVKNITDIKKDIAGEIFSSHELNGKYKGFTNSHYYMQTLIPKSCIGDIEYFDGSESLSDIVDVHKQKICNGVTLFKNEFGERFCIMPNDETLFMQFTNVNHRRKEQLINVFSWIANKPLPICAENELVCVNINEFEGYNTITLFNLQCDDIECPKIKYSVKGALKFVNDDGEILDLDYDIENNVVKINRQLRATRYLVIVDEFC